LRGAKPGAGRGWNEEPVARHQSEVAVKMRLEIRRCDLAIVTLAGQTCSG
jgi:hypothetical protein